MNRTYQVIIVWVRWRCEITCPPFHDKLFVLVFLPCLNHKFGRAWASPEVRVGLDEISPNLHKQQPSQTTRDHPERAARVRTPNTLPSPVSRGLGRCLINSDTRSEVFPWLTVIDSAIPWFVSALWRNWLAIRKLGRPYWITIQKDWVSVSTGFRISFICLSTCLSLSSEYISHFQ